MSARRSSTQSQNFGSISSDRDLVDGLRTRAESALAEIYKRHGGAVFGLSRRVLNDDGLAEDVTQEIFLRLWNEPQRFDAERGTLRSYLNRQSHSRSIERVRSEEAHRRREDRSVESDKPESGAIESEVLASIESNRIRTALDQLGQKERRAIVLAYYGGHSYREVASRLRLPEGTVKSQLRTGLQHLSVLLNDGQPEEDQ
ncbi:RpoE DNA-directed RNA polymerase specialized sigma subunit, sigma24 homolog [Acidimicrobiia bacterium]